VNNAEADAHMIHWSLEQARHRSDRRAVRFLERLIAKAEHGPLDLIRVFACVARYGGYVDSEKARKHPRRLHYRPSSLVWGCPHYSLTDLLHALSAPLFAPASLYAEMAAFDVLEQAKRIEVPVYFLQGRRDVVTAFLVERYYEALDAPRGKRLVIFENSPHTIRFSEPEEYVRWLTEIPAEVLR
jgi:pimeloyl-ACP methyl ester carboxylesterase